MVSVHNGLWGEVFVFVPWPLEDAGSWGCLHCLSVFSVRDWRPYQSLDPQQGGHHGFPLTWTLVLEKPVQLRRFAQWWAGTQAWGRQELGGRCWALRPASADELLRQLLKLAARNSALLSSRMVFRWHLWLIQGNSQSGSAKSPPFQEVPYFQWQSSQSL